MRALFFAVVAAVVLAAPARAGLFRRDPAQIPPYHRYGAAWRFYNYEYKERFHPQYSPNYFGNRR
jgi:hypothetical protein